MYQDLKNKTRKIGVYAAHDDDSILGVGGKIAQHLKNGDEVYIVICADGRNSHKAVLGIETNPSIWEVKAKREEEIKEAAEILGVAKERLYFLELTDGEGRVWQNEESAKRQIIEITEKEKPDLIYFHYPDAHTDHRAVSKIVSEMLDRLEVRPKSYQFFIWTKELAKDRPEVNASQVPEIPQDILRIDIREELGLKRKALFEMKSQVNVWPYSDWQVQEKPILDKKFIDYFLRGEEVFVKVK